MYFDFKSNLVINNYESISSRLLK